ncbi:MAG: DUF1553 domain-containing protein [Planctomycetota bacterium]
MRIGLFFLSGMIWAAGAAAQQRDDPVEATSAPPEQEAQAVARWSFDGPVMGTWVGAPKIETTSLHGQEFPALDAANKAAFFTGKGVYLKVREKDIEGNLRFDSESSITLEAWVNPASLGDKAFMYIVGKGRTDNPGFAAENQNYALRLAGVQGEARVSFLFRSAKTAELDGAMHRWTANAGFKIGSGWHHVAVSYTFGRPDSLRGYLDGAPVAGVWDMAGATTRAPVVDGDDVWIGSAKKGAPGNSFHGWLDEVAIYRTALPPASIARHARRIAPVAVVMKLPVDRVLVEICEDGVPAENAWPAVRSPASESYTAEAFGFFRTPQKYVDTGVRGDRPNPYLLRAGAEVKLPAGAHRLLLRGRGAARLFVDGQMILSTPFASHRGDGHNPIPTNYLDLGPDFRFAPPGNREAWVAFASPGKTHQIVLETIVGGKRGKAGIRPELGETVVALSPAGMTSFHLVSPQQTITYNDLGWNDYREREERRLADLEKARRAAAWNKARGPWDRRREETKAWLGQTPEIDVPALPAGFPANNAIDHFLAQKLVAIRAEASTPNETIDFLKEVKPILETRCFSCHEGKKAKGGLRLDSLAALLTGGDSETPALVRGEPDKSLLLSRILSDDPNEKMPPQGDRLKPAEVAALKTWIASGARWSAVPAAELTLSGLSDDLTFLRRLSLDVVGVVPSLAEIREFLADTRRDKRAQWIDRYLADPRWADAWVGYWQDVLGENPNILNPTLNNTGPYRWWIYESFLDNKPIDVFASDLLLMRGSHFQGGPAGFAMASENDVPMAEKGVIVGAAFLAVQMKCARCHDAPAHKWTQKELFSLAAMLDRKSIVVPKTSSVPKDKIHGLGRAPLIKVTLQPGVKVDPAWPFAEFSADANVEGDAREQAAALISSPRNERFAQVIANRVWAKFMGRGIVEPIDDFEKGEPTHPELLKWLGRELVRSGYDVKQLTRLILTSHAYQRAVNPALAEPSAYHAAVAKRSLTAEQVVDSLFVAAGKRMDTEEVNLDVDGSRDQAQSISLGKPTRAWQFASTSNERDRPSLALPRVQAVVDVLEAFGWRPTRPDARTTRETAPNVLQPAILANGAMSVWLTRLSEEHGVTRLALEEQPVEKLVDRLVQQALTRKPRSDERHAMMAHLNAGYANRIVTPPAAVPAERKPPRYVSWSNHLTNEANEIKILLETAARRGDPPTRRLDPEWRERLEDVLWSLLNSPEFVFRP